MGVANAQHGIVRGEQLRALGWSSSAISRSRALHRLYRSVYAVGHTALSQEGRWLAAVFAAGEGAALCRKCTAALMKVKRWAPREPEVLVPRTHRPIPGVKLHTARSLDPLDVTVVNGIPVTNLPRVFVDLSDELIPEALKHYMHEAAFRGLDLQAVRRAMDRANGRHNLEVLETAIRDWLHGSAGTRSKGEAAFRRAVSAAGLPRPATNRKLLGIEVDFHWPELRLVIEIDGPPHSRPPSRWTDAERDAALTAAGYRVARFRTPEAALEHLAGYSTTRLGASPQSCSSR